MAAFTLEPRQNCIRVILLLTLIILTLFYYWLLPSQIAKLYSIGNMTMSVTEKLRPTRNMKDADSFSAKIYSTKNMTGGNFSKTKFNSTRNRTEDSIFTQNRKYVNKFKATNRNRANHNISNSFKHWTKSTARLIRLSQSALNMTQSANLMYSNLSTLQNIVRVKTSKGKDYLIWRQFQYYILHNKSSENVELTTKSTYQYKISQYLQNTKRSIELILYEQDKEVFSNGGSSFHVTSESMRNIRICDVTDFFNGTYIISCPALRNCLTVKVYLMFVNFMAFRNKKANPMNIYIKNEKYCLKQKIKVIPKLTSNCYVNPGGLVTWVQDESWKLQVDNCLIDNVKYSNIRRCIKRYRSVVFLGDSHTRFNLFYTMYKLGILDPNLPRFLKRHYKKENLYFQWNTYLESLSRQMLNISNRLCRTTGNHILITNNGHWDLSHRSLQFYFENFYKVVQAAKSIVTKCPNILLIWTCIVAFPDKHKDHGRSARNNFAIAAANYWSRMQLKSVGVHVFDMTFDGTRILNNIDVCMDHYLCKLDRQRVVLGLVGGPIMDALLTFICQPHTRI